MNICIVRTALNFTSCSPGIPGIIYAAFLLTMLLISLRVVKLHNKTEERDDPLGK